MADSGYKNISRIDDAPRNNHGWYVRVQYKGKSYAKFFGDTRYGGSDSALEEAVTYRNQLEAKIGKPRTERLIIGKLHPGNNTGVSGVRRTQRVERKRGRTYTRNVYEITWNPEPGRVSRTTVSIDKYGEEEAFQRACAIRKKKIAEIYKASRTPDLPEEDGQEESAE